MVYLVILSILTLKSFFEVATSVDRSFFSSAYLFLAFFASLSSVIYFLNFDSSISLARLSIASMDGLRAYSIGSRYASS